MTQGPVYKIFKSLDDIEQKKKTEVRKLTSADQKRLELRKKQLHKKLKKMTG